jgi:hypothetical protein
VRVTSFKKLINADRDAELVLIWHEHRLLILLSALVVATVARLAIYARDRRERLSVSPAPLSPFSDNEKKTVELKPEWLPEYSTTLSRPDDTGAVALIAKKGPKTVKGRRTPKKRVTRSIKTSPMLPSLLPSSHYTLLLLYPNTTRAVEIAEFCKNYSHDAEME